MNKPRRSTKNTDDLDDDLGDLLENMPETDPENDSFERVLAELSSDTDGAQVHIFRDVKGKINGAYLFIVPPAEFDMVSICDKLRDDYGGGEFRAVLKKHGRIIKSSPISIEVPRTRLPGFIPQAPDKSGDAMANLIASMQENTRAMMEAARQESRDNQKQMNAMMLEIIKAGANRAHEPTPVAELVQVLAMSKQLGGGGESGGIDSLLKGIELGKELAGGGDSESPLLGALKTIAPAIQQGLAIQAAQAKHPAPRPASRPAPGLTRPPGSTQAPPQVESEPDQMAEFMLLTKMLKRAAQKQSDPGLYVDLLLDQIDEAVLMSAFEDDAQYAGFVSFIPGGLTPTEKVWLDEVRECLLTLPENDGDLTDAEAVSDDARGDGSADTAHAN